MTHLFSLNLTHSLLFLPWNWAFDRIKQEARFFQWIDNQKRRSLAFRRTTFLENLAIPLRCASEDVAKRLMHNYWLAMKSSVSTFMGRDTATRSWKNRKAFRAAERWRLNKHHLSLIPWKTKNMATGQLRSWKTPIKWSLTRRSIPNKPDDLPKTFCIVTSRREIRGGKMQRASVNMVKATEELKNCVKGLGCNRYIYIYT